MRAFDKPAINVEQQIQTLKDRGLTIRNESSATLFLQAVGFFRLSAYMRPYEILSDSDHKFVEGTTFKQITQTYEFDRKLRLHLIAAIERVEVAIRAIINNHMGPEYDDAHWYLNRSLFRNHYSHDRLLQTIDDKQCKELKNYQRECDRIDNNRHRTPKQKEILKAKRAKENYARHYPINYESPSLMPGWAMLEELTLGDLSHLYAGQAKDIDKKAIARDVGLTMPLLESWLKTLNTIRNICAHHSRLWNRELGLKPELPRNSNFNWPAYQREYQGHMRIAVVMSILQHFMTQISPHDGWTSKLFNLFDKYPEINQAMMGLPKNWQDDPFWN